MTGSTSNAARDEVIAIKIADMLRVASMSGEIRPQLQHAMRKAAECLEAALQDIQRERLAA